MHLPRLGFALFALASLVGCSDDGGGGGGGSGEKFTVSGRVSSVSARRAPSAAAATARTVTHVMAVNPESASPQRTLAKVSADGSFSLALQSGKPYVLAFLDDTAVGADMLVALFRAQTLDTLAPQVGGELALGALALDAETQSTTLGISYDALLAGLGLSADAAEYLGAVDDLSLRYANPDIDGDGIIDLEQDHNFALDFHVRANLKVGGHNVTINDLTDQTLAASGANVATPVFNLTSAYVLYPKSFDGTSYVSMTPPPSLINGAQFAATEGGHASPFPPTSYSSLSFGDTAGFGADYNYDGVPGLELPGSSGAPATLAYTLGSSGKTLTFTNVVTRTRASLTDSGSLAIFVRLNTTNGTYSSIDYQWMKRDSATSWVPATAEEIALTISGDGGYVSFHHTPNWSNEFGTVFPPQPSGSIPWTWQSTTPDQICGLAVSFDDKLGLRHFVGGADANAGVTCTYQ